MIVCSCNVLTDGDVKACLRDAAECPRTPAQVYRCLGCSPNCGSCARTIRSIMNEALAGAQAELCGGCAACPSHAPHPAHDAHMRHDAGPAMAPPEGSRAITAQPQGV